MTCNGIILLSPGKIAEPFWPVGQSRLHLTIENGTTNLVARGYDPDSNAGVFKADLRPDQKDAFIKAVREAWGAQQIPTPPGNDNLGVVVISGPGPGEGSGPKLYLLDLTDPGGSAVAGRRTMTSVRHRRAAQAAVGARRTQDVRRRSGKAR